MALRVNIKAILQLITERLQVFFEQTYSLQYHV